ncbi:MAG: hypothetical protein JG777_2627 [Clostridia bacterium]|nr:hypothetical protein [Clostridia bacterium]
MFVFITIKKWTLICFTCLMAVCIFFILCLYKFMPGPPDKPEASTTFVNEEISQVIQKIFEIRNRAILEGDLDAVKPLYNLSTKYGTWAYEHEVKKTKYLHKWSDKQGVKFKDIHSTLVIRYGKEKGSVFSVNFIASTEYKYAYENEPDTVNSFRIGTYHIVDLIQKDGQWLIAKEWYTDPFADSLSLDDIKSQEIKTYILSGKPRDFSGLSERRIQAVEYADRYCGAASEEKYGFKYNEKYRDYNPQGGDCANFASQILYEGGKFKKTHTWNYDSGGASKAWVNAHAFNSYMLNSGRASRIAYGSYNQVYKASYKLQPGDYIAYEKKGKITHISVVTGADSKGYTLVSCHNTDRNRVPWDLGWSDKGIKFWLVHVNY